jgi:hypothetical protein
VVGVFRYFKNGAPRKAPEVTLSFCPEQIKDECGLVANSATERVLASSANWIIIHRVVTEEHARRGYRRPYRVNGRHMASGQSFGHLSKALVVFLSEANRLAPGRAV